MSVAKAPPGGLLETSGIIVQVMEVTNGSPDGGGEFYGQGLPLSSGTPGAFHTQQPASVGAFPPQPLQTVGEHQENPSQNVSYNMNTCPDSNKRKRFDADQGANDNIRYNVSVSSRYDVLQTLDNTDHDESEKTVKIPPIFIHNVNDYGYLLLISDIKEVVKNEFTIKQQKDFYQVNFVTIEDYRNYRKFCDGKNIQYHSFRDPYHSKLSVIIYGIPTVYSEKEIYDELVRLKFPVTKVTRLFNKNREPLWSCAVDLSETGKAKSIFNETKLFYSIIKVRLRNTPNNVIQCKRCQRFKHSQANCKLNPRCVRCDGSHHYSQCKRPKKEQPICVNCGGNHTANYRGCIKFKEAENERKQRQGFYSAQPSKTAVRSTQPPRRPPPTDNIQNFPPLPKVTMVSPQQNYELPNANWTTHSSRNTNNTNLISTIVNQILAIIIPQIQTMIQSLVPAFINGIK